VSIFFAVLVSTCDECDLSMHETNEIKNKLSSNGLSIIAHNGHALAGQFITFCRNVCPVNEQIVEIFILLLNRIFSAGNYSPTTNKKLMKCTSAQLLPM
jgi:hypothetical protein